MQSTRVASTGDGDIILHIIDDDGEAREGVDISRHNGTWKVKLVDHQHSLIGTWEGLTANEVLSVFGRFRLHRAQKFALAVLAHTGRELMYMECPGRNWQVPREANNSVAWSLAPNLDRRNAVTWSDIVNRPVFLLPNSRAPGNRQSWVQFHRVLCGSALPW